MPANVETMFYVRETPWHGLGERVEEALSSKQALKLSGLDWKVNQKVLFTSDNVGVPKYKANVRSTDGEILGVVSDKYKIVQNDEAFSFTDLLLGEGVRYETAGSLQNGKKVWLLARLPETFMVAGDTTNSYLVFTNSHDGSGSIKVAITPIRVVCQNTLNLALHDAKRFWSMPHVGDVDAKLNEARKALLLAEFYMKQLDFESSKLNAYKITDRKVADLIQDLLPIPSDATEIQENNMRRLRDDLSFRFYEAPDLKDTPKSAWRFVNAVSDFATHVKPLRKTKNYKETLFSKTIDGNGFIDKAYEMVKELV